MSEKISLDSSGILYEIRGPNRHRYRILERIRDLEMDYR